MKRVIRRTLGIIVGLMLGWWFAGVAMQTSDPWLGVSYGAGVGDETDPNKAIYEYSAGEHAQPHHDTGHGAGHKGDHHDQGVAAAELLMPGSLEQVCWYRPVVTTTGGLFIAAVVLGIPALALRGPEPPDPADAHGHDDHH